MDAIWYSKKIDAALLREEHFFKSAQKTPFFIAKGKGGSYCDISSARFVSSANKEDAVSAFTALGAEHKISARIKAGR